MAEKITKPRLCGHCNNEVPFTLKAEYSYKDNEYDTNWELETILKAYTNNVYRLFECQTCHKATLELESEWYGRTDDWENEQSPSYEGQFEPDDVSTIKILYPLEQVETNYIPGEILLEYREALKVRHNSPLAFAAMVGRTLEAIYEEEKVKGKSFKEKLNDLVDKGRIPQSLVDTVTHIYKLRNLGAHYDKEQRVTKEDVPVILDFLNALLEYLYIAPAKIKAIQAETTKYNKTN